jgi:cyclophilin family peptidyl-prolyl cis-trans isomerase
MLAGAAFLAPVAMGFAEEGKAGEPQPRVLMKTSLGDITIELNREKSPVTVENFLKYVDEKKYDGTIFHRVMQTFMIQGGGYLPGYVKVETHKPIKNESGNGLKNEKYAIAMARTQDLNSATNQFFINTVDNFNLDEMQYCAFGKVVEGTDVVDKIAAVPVKNEPIIGNQPAPVTPVVIHSVERAGAKADGSDGSVGSEESKK